MPRNFGVVSRPDAGAHRPAGSPIARRNSIQSLSATSQTRADSSAQMRLFSFLLVAAIVATILLSSILAGIFEIFDLG